MGISGQIGHPQRGEAYEKVGAACRANGKALGMGGVYDKEDASRYIKAGARMVLSGSDHNLSYGRRQGALGGAARGGVTSTRLPAFAAPEPGYCAGASAFLLSRHI